MNTSSNYCIDAVKFEERTKTANCYEYIPDTPVKLYLDVDVKKSADDGEDLMEEAPRLLDGLKQCISSFFHGNFDESNLAITESHSSHFIPHTKTEPISKISFGFVINNMTATKAQQKILVKQLNDFAKHTMDAEDLQSYYPLNVFDDAPYADIGKSQKIRCINASKPNEKRPKKLLQGTFQQACITAFIPPDAIKLDIEIPVRNESVSTEHREDRVNLQIFKNALHLLKPFAGNGQYSNWSSIIWAIKNEFDDFELARQFSRLDSTAYDESALQILWDSTIRREDGVLFGSITRYMKQTNENEYNSIVREVYKSKMREAGIKSLQHIIEEDANNINADTTSYYIKIDDIDDPYRCAIVISKTLKNNLVLCKEKWFMVNNENLWKSQNEATFYITTEIRKYIDEGNRQNAEQISRAEGDAKDKLIEVGKRYLKSYKDISKPAYMSVVTKNLKTLLNDPLFVDKIDKLTDCLAFKNGIYNMKTNTFRRGILQSDFITETIQYDYNPANSQKTQFVKNVLLKILNNNPEHLEYFLSVIGYTFIGQPNLEKSFYFCVDKTPESKGDNGKTFYFDILGELMPCYVYKTKGIFLEKDNAKKHKQLALMRGKRLVWVDEFGTKYMDAIFVKELANGLSTENEVMFGTSENICIQFKVFGLTNHMVKIGENEDSVFNRFSQISYGSHFDRFGKLKQDIPEQLKFIADTSLRETFLRDYRDEIFGLIIEYANKYYTRKLPQIPLQFANDAQETKMANDEFATWINKNCVIEGEARVALKVLIYASGMNEIKVKDGMKRLGFVYNKELKGIGKDNYGKLYKGGYIGIKLLEKDTETDDEEEEYEN